MKISKALRREAIELAGCRASFWVGAGPYPGRGDDRGKFSDAACSLANEAHSHAINFEDPRIHNEDSAHVWAEAQAMLLDGWTP